MITNQLTGKTFERDFKSNRRAFVKSEVLDLMKSNMADYDGNRFDKSNNQLTN